MSSDYSLSGSQWDVTQWKNDVYDLFRIHGWDMIHPEDFELSDELSGCFTAGAIRGILFEKTNETEWSIRVNTFASKNDFYFLFTVLNLGLQNGAIARHEDSDQVLTGDDLGGDKHLEHWQSWWDVALNVARSRFEGSEPEASLTIYGPNGGLKLTADDFQPGEVEHLHDRLSLRVRRYAEAYSASLMTCEVNQRELRLAVYSNIPTLIPKEADFLTFPSEDHLIIATPDFKRLVSGILEEDSFFYLPGDLFKNDHTLREKVREMGYAEPQDIPVGLSHTPESGDTDEQMRNLAKGPILVFLTVAAADGTIDKSERKAFEKICQSPSKVSPDPAFAIMLNLTLSSFAETIEECLTGDVAQQLHDIRQAIENSFDPERATHMKHCLLKLGYLIADSSGGGLLGKVFAQKRIDDSEKTALMGLAHLLGVEME